MVALFLASLVRLSGPAEPPILFVDAGDHLLLERAPGAECAGAPRLVAEGTAVACAPQAVDAEPHRRWVGRHVRLTGGKAACTAEVVSVDLLAWFDPHFALMDAWRWPPRGGRPAMKRVARAAWQRANWDDRFLTAHVRLVDPAACKGARWATLDQAREIQPAAGTQGPLHAQALEQFRRLPGHAAVQAQFMAEDGAVGLWDSFDGAAPVVTRFDTVVGRFVYAGAQVGGCGDFDGAFWAIWQVGDDGHWSPVADATTVGHWFQPEGLLGAKGRLPTFIGHQRRIEARGQRYEVVEDVSVHGYICPC